MLSGARAREAATRRGDEFATILASALDEAAKAATAATAAAARPAPPLPLPPPPTITIDSLELPPERDGYSSVEKSFSGPNSAFFDAFLEKRTPENENAADDENGGGKKRRQKASTVFERRVQGKYPLVLQLEVDVCATGPGWLDAALEPLVTVVEGKEKRGGRPATSGEVSAAVARAVEALRHEEEFPSLPLLSTLPAVVGATLGGGCVHVSSLPGSPIFEGGHRPYCSPLAAQPRHMREHLNGNALYLATSKKFQRLARVARAVAGEGNELPFDLALWAAAELLSEAEEEEEEEGARGAEERGREKEAEAASSLPVPALASCCGTRGCSTSGAASRAPG